MKFLVVLSAVLAVSSCLPVDSEFVPNSPENVAKLASGNYKQNAWELSGQFEGDMILSLEQIQALIGLARNGLINTRYRWTNNVVPYTIDESYFTQEQIDFIDHHLKTFAAVSCVTVRRKVASDVDWVYITGKPDGCYSSVGRRGGAQNLNLAPYPVTEGCFRSATILHEFLHALGFYHQQSASERDNYVTIMWDNITPGMEHNFNKYGEDVVTNFGVAYDYGSVMHYGPYGFSINGDATIVPKDPTAEIGQRVAMSEKDIEKLKLMYC